jgi:hypothetical protein
MAKPVPRVHICFGNPDRHLAELERAAEKGTSDGWWWTINRWAIPGDRIIFYLIRPMSAFVASAVVASKPWVVEDRDSDWYGHYGVEVKDVQMLPRHVALQEARRRFPDWRYLRQPYRSTPIPSEMVGDFLAFLHAGTLQPLRPNLKGHNNLRFMTSSGNRASRLAARPRLPRMEVRTQSPSISSCIRKNAGSSKTRILANAATCPYANYYCCTGMQTCSSSLSQRS